MMAQYPALIQEQIAGTPLLSSCSSDRASVEHMLAYLGTLCDPQGHAVNTTALAPIAALLERAECAERDMADKDREVRYAEERAEAAEQRAAPDEPPAAAGAKTAHAGQRDL
jgi:hypothetical protein